MAKKKTAPLKKSPPRGSKAKPMKAAGALKKKKGGASLPPQ
jgi:hypothetical protein